MQRSKVAWLAVATLAVATSAFAGKLERDKQAELKPKIEAAQKATKAACGCAPAFNVKWDSYKAADDMMRIEAVLEAFVTSAKNQCNSAENKKAMCTSLSAIDISYSKEAAGQVELKGKTIACTTNDSTYCGDHQFTAILNKF